MKRILKQMVMMGGALTYRKKVMQTFGSSLVGYWPLDEASGTTAKDISGNGYNGTYGNVTLGQTGLFTGETCPLFDSTTDYVSLYSAGFAGAFNGNEGTFSCWFKPINGNVYFDGTGRYIVNIQADSNNLIYVTKKSTASYYMRGQRSGGGTIKANEVVNVNPTAWTHIAVTWSKTADQQKTYLNGVQYAATETGLGTYTGTPALHNTTLGNLLDNGAGLPWLGWLAHAAIGNTALPESSIRRLANTNWGGGFKGLMIEFDDGDVSTLDAYTYMVSKGVRGSFNVITGLIDTAGYLTSANLATMEAAGMAICNHTDTATVLTTLSEAQQETAIGNAITALTGWGLSSVNAHHLAYPNGGWNADTLTAMTNLSMLTGREANPRAGFTSLDPTVDFHYVLKTHWTAAATSDLASVQAVINTARANEKYCLIFFHRFTAGAASGNQWTYANFNALIDWIVAQGIPCITRDEYYDAGPR